MKCKPGYRKKGARCVAVKAASSKLQVPKLNLVRERTLEEPQRGLIFWFEDEGTGMTAAVYGQPHNVHARVCDNILGCHELKFPFASADSTPQQEQQFRDAIEMDYEHRFMYEKGGRR